MHQRVLVDNLRNNWIIVQTVQQCDVNINGKERFSTSSENQLKEKRTFVVHYCVILFNIVQHKLSMWKVTKHVRWQFFLNYWGT